MWAHSQGGSDGVKGRRHSLVVGPIRSPRPNLSGSPARRCPTSKSNAESQSSGCDHETWPPVITTLESWKKRTHDGPRSHR
jgi:hypothetical protein